MQLEKKVLPIGLACLLCFHQSKERQWLVGAATTGFRQLVLGRDFRMTGA